MLSNTSTVGLGISIAAPGVYTPRQDPPNADVKPHLGDAMEEAAKLFETPATRAR